ncbi:MAG TPA: hypothetical protein VFC12_07895 [Terriglobales bacterium]|nr:hypothetical protein [Terriglobales bacterium]
MIQLHDVAAVVVVCGGVAALTSRDARGVAAGLLVAMAASPLASSPAPSTLAMAVRVVGALLATYLLWTAARGRSVSGEGSSGGLPAGAALAAAAFCVGWWASPVAPLPGSLAAQAAGVSVAVMAVVPLAGRDPLRGGTALVGLIVAFSMLLEAWIGPASPLQQLVWTALLVGATGATSVLISPVAESAVEIPMAIQAAWSVAASPAADEVVDTAAAADGGATGQPEPIKPEPIKPAGPDEKTQRVLGAREGRLRPRDHR